MFKALASRIQNIDSFPKTLEDFRVRSASGGVISIATFVIIAVLFISELSSTLKVTRHVDLKVDDVREPDLKIIIDIDFPHINCEFLGIDAVDASGNIQIDVSNNLYKHKIDEKGRLIKASGKAPRLHKFKKMDDPNYCGSCYGAETRQGQCCNTCEDVKKAYTLKGWLISDAGEVEQCVREGLIEVASNKYIEGEGCKVKGSIVVAKIQGNVHICPGHTVAFQGAALHDISIFKEKFINMTHTVNSIAFGDHFPRRDYPLEGASSVAHTTQDIGIFEYYMKIVPTTYKTNFRSQNTHQYSVTENFRRVDMSVMPPKEVPGVYFVYEMSPFRVHIEDKRGSITHFLTSICAIIGGVVTVSGLVDSIVFHGNRILRKNKQPELLK